MRTVRIRYLLQGRVRFLDIRGASQQTPFSLMVLTLGATSEQKDRYAELVPGFWLTHSVTVASGDQRQRSPTLDG
jgi:hypothetical protein